ncbi:MAG: Hpt domain-containing protein [Parabacteroides sp.]|nr:Hpt domain-containing protein [Parabacteroides sp.]
MSENDAFYNALIDVAAWDKENTLDRFMNSNSLFKKFLYKFITTDGSYAKLRNFLAEQDLENAKLYSHTLKGIAANLGLVNLYDVSNSILLLLREGKLEDALRHEDELGKQYDAVRDIVVKYCS